jgi:hypothetical protein
VLEAQLEEYKVKEQQWSAGGGVAPVGTVARRPVSPEDVDVSLASPQSTSQVTTAKEPPVLDRISAAGGNTAGIVDTTGGTSVVTGGAFVGVCRLFSDVSDCRYCREWRRNHRGGAVATQ